MGVNRGGIRESTAGSPWLQASSTGRRVGDNAPPTGKTDGLFVALVRSVRFR